MSKLVKLDEPKYFSVSDYKPIITYAGDIELFKNLEATLSQALPQEKAEWRRSFGRGIREVTLQAVFMPFSVDILQKVDNYHLLKEPVLHIFWTQCADVETYKTVLYDKIKHWLQILQRHNVVDWLIVLVETYDFRKHNKLLPRTTVLDKIKSDFGVKHIDRCLSVINPLKSEMRTVSSWRALVVNIRLLMLTAYDSSLLKFEEFIRAQRENRNQPEWSFCNYFLLQEELAFALEMLGVYEEALIQYDELEAMFTQFIKNSSLTDAPVWLSSFQISVNSWSSISLTSEVNQNYREAIKNHRISLLDFRCYLFCRQAAMLLSISKSWEVANRTLPFIHNCLNEIRILEVYYPDGALACWIFLCCLEIILMCQNLKENTHSDACSWYTAPLMELAVCKLREVGELCGLMPDCEQTSQQLHTIVVLSSGIGDPLRFPNKNNVCPVDKLKEALSSKEAYCKIYLELSEQAVITYKHRKRIRSARYVEKQIADFYMRMGELSKAAQFLVNPLSSYEAENWPVLANQIRFKLLKCYTQMNETEKLLRTSISIASSAQFDLAVQISSFNNVLRILQETQEDIEWICPLEESFIVENISIEVQKSSLQIKAFVNIVNKFPCDVMCSNFLISIHSCSNNDIKIKNSLKMTHKNMTVKNFDTYSTNNTSTTLPLMYVLEYQQDKSLAGARILCDNQDVLLRRKDSQKLIKPTLPVKKTYSKKLTAVNVVLKPGNNTVIFESKEEEMSGTFYLGQLSVTVLDKLTYISSENSYSDIRYTIKHISPKVILQVPENRTLITGIKSIVNLHINLGTYSLNKEAHLILRTSKGLTVAIPDNINLKDEIKFDLSSTCSTCVSDNYNLSIPIIVRSEFSSQTEAIIDHKIWLKCPWSESEISLVLQFFVPFIVLRQIHTAKLQKFVQITVVGSTKESVILKDPLLSVISDNKFIVKSLNPSFAQPFVVNNILKVKFMWELMLADIAVDRCMLEFSVNYSVYDEISSYRYKFDITNFMTLYFIESKVDPSRGCECCRVNMMCHLMFTVRRVAPTTDHSLKYEVITDQTMWAVCNVSSGVIILDETDKCLISVDLMPLSSGYLPLPIIKLSKYFPAESNLELSPRFEPFCQGQVYNANKATQAQVLPPLNMSES